MNSCTSLEPGSPSSASPSSPTNWPRPERAKAFSEPWQAQAFALVVALEKAGHITKNEWAQALGRAIQGAQAKGDPDTGETYYLHWLSALEALVQDKALASASTLNNTRAAWAHAVQRTAHGQPIELRAQDFAQTP